MAKRIYAKHRHLLILAWFFFAFLPSPPCPSLPPPRVRVRVLARPPAGPRDAGAGGPFSPPVCSLPNTPVSGSRARIHHQQTPGFPSYPFYPQRDGHHLARSTLGPRPWTRFPIHAPWEMYLFRVLFCFPPPSPFFHHGACLRMSWQALLDMDASRCGWLHLRCPYPRPRPYPYPYPCRAVPLQQRRRRVGSPLPLRSEGNAAVRQGTLASLGLPPSFLPCARQGCDGWMDEKNARDGDRGWT